MVQKVALLTMVFRDLGPVPKSHAYLKICVSAMGLWGRMTNPRLSLMLRPVTPSLRSQSFCVQPQVSGSLSSGPYQTKPFGDLPYFFPLFPYYAGLHHTSLKCAITNNSLCCTQMRTHHLKLLNRSVSEIFYLDMYLRSQMTPGSVHN